MPICTSAGHKKRGLLDRIQGKDGQDDNLNNLSQKEWLVKVGPVVMLKFMLSTSLPVAMANLIDPKGYQAVQEEDLASCGGLCGGHGRPGGSFLHKPTT